LEGLFIVVAIAIAIMNLSQKQKQNQRKSQGGMKRQPSTMRQDPIQQWMRNLQQPDSTVRGEENRREEGLGGTGEHQLGSMLPESNEGLEIKDRDIRGSMGYMQQSQSSEGICTQHPEHERQKLKEKKAAPMLEIIENEEDDMFALTEEGLLRSIVMAEVLGPPRAMKRRIR
jgi:hypothetical protein